MASERSGGISRRDLIVAAAGGAALLAVNRVAGGSGSILPTATTECPTPTSAAAASVAALSKQDVAPDGHLADPADDRCSAAPEDEPEDESDDRR
ncbi:MAG TPA: hypothetical protein VFC93_06160 [Chloroflexota bacterium]|nr:hypothetical protein [Chloroflexota bacterium]